MTHTYNITGMTCNGCVAKVRSELLKIGDITEATIQLEAPQAAITMLKHVPTQALQNAINKAGNYTITEAEMLHENNSTTETTSWLQTYKPILLIGTYITGVTFVTATINGSFDLQIWMQHFMAAFFLVFSFFKMLDVKGFAESYSTYDIVAKNWANWGYIYAFVELGLGVAYLTDFHALLTNAVTFAVMGISIIGVLQSVLNKRKIKCACLGAVFNLPMSTITIIEDALMIAMSAFMLLTLM